MKMKITKRSRTRQPQAGDTVVVDKSANIIWLAKANGEVFGKLIDGHAYVVKNSILLEGHCRDDQPVRIVEIIVEEAPA